jgi:hypothetical protein
MPGQAAKVAISAIAAAAAGAKDYKKINGTTVFRMSKYMGRLGGFSVLAGAVFAVLAILNVPPHVIGWIVFALLFGGLGLPLFIAYVVSRVYVDDESITLKNSFGKRKQVFWRDIRCAYDVGVQHDIKICCSSGSMKIGAYFSGFKHLIALMEEHRPGVFAAETVMASPGVKTADGAAFKRGKAIGNVGIFMVLLGAGPALIPSEGIANAVSKVFLAAFFGGCGIYFLLSCYVSRVVLNAESITYRNAFGMTRSIRWEDIRYANIRREKGRDTREFIRVTGRDRTIIKIPADYCGYGVIKGVIRQRHPKGMK